MKPVTECIGNALPDLGATGAYAAILGESPSRGAKSPVLWNAAFRGLGLSGVMHPMDVAPGELAGAVQALRADRRYIGGAVTMPYKIDIVALLDELEPEAEAIGAVNCVYRGRDGRSLVGANTDGAGALWSLAGEFGELAGARVLLLGAGGAACAVAAYVARAVGPQGRLVLCNRDAAKAEALAARVGGFCPVEVAPWPVTPALAPGLDVLVNCTVLGFETLRSDADGAYSLRWFTPLAAVDASARVAPGPGAVRRHAVAAAQAIADNASKSIEFLGALDRALVFDIVYQPRQTFLLRLAELMELRTLGGVAMNLEQAVIAFDKATAAAGLRRADASEIRPIMAEVW